MTGWRFTAVPAAVTNRFVVSVNMANGPYTLANTTQPTAGARKVTVATTAATGADTQGTILVTGTNLAGQVMTETLVPVSGSTVTGAKLFKTVTSVVQSGWSIVGGNDTIIVGCDAVPFVVDGYGQVHTVVVAATAAGTITLADATGTLLVLKASIVENSYLLDLNVNSFLSVVLGAASDVTIVTTDPSTAF